jgi:hypothetical protein
MAVFAARGLPLACVVWGGLPYDRTTVRLYGTSVPYLLLDSNTEYP